MHDVKGFTLIELLIVVAIIGILSAVGIPMYSGYIAQAKYNSGVANYKAASDVVKNELTKCEVLGYVNLRADPNTWLTYNHQRNGPQPYKKILCESIRHPQMFGDMFIDHFISEGFHNPYSPSDYVTQRGKGGYGHIGIYGTNWKCDLGLKSYVIDPSTGASVRMSDKFSLKGLIRHQGC